MARTVAALPAGSRITDYISLGVIAKFFPMEKIREILEQTKRASVRERDLPAHVVVYYVIALALYMRSSYREVLRCLLEGVQWLLPLATKIKVVGKSGISQARSRLGVEPIKRLYQAVVAPIAEKRTRGAWYQQWRLVSLDGGTLDVADTAENEQAFGRPGASRGASAYPQIRFVGLLESGTQVLWAAIMDQYKTDEITLAATVVPALRKGMLCLAERFFPRLRFVAQGRANRCRPALASPQERTLGGGPALGGWILPQSHLSVHVRPPERAEGDGRPRHRISLERCSRRGADLSADHHHPGPPIGASQRTGSPISRAVGDRDGPG